MIRIGGSVRPFRWAYIGSGSIANNTARNITKGDHVIAAVYSRNTEKAGEFAKKYSAQTYARAEDLFLAGGFDGVYIATPHTSHMDYAIQAMQAGYPVLCEKPVGVSLEQAERMVRTSHEKGVYYCEAMWTWFSDLPYEVKKWIETNRLGDIVSVSMQYAFPGVMMSRNSRLLKPETAGGALLDIGVYPITYCYRLFGFPQRIECTGTLKNGIDVDETVTLGYNGFDCTLEISLTKLGERCRITGTAGSVTVPVFHMARLAHLKTAEGRRSVTGKTDYLTEFTRAADEIRQGRTESAYVPHQATLDCLKIMDECRRQMGLVYPFEAP